MITSKHLSADELRQKFLNFFKSRGHKILPSSSLLPENDPTSVFTSAGMQPLVPYLMGEKHPEGDKIANIQRCVRTGDIDEVGDESHLTFFEMMGYWSLGSYWKKEAIELIFEFLTKELGIDPKNFAVSCFEGDESNGIPKDSESAGVWRSLGIPEDRIAYLGYEDNWWGPVGDTGPCGPDSELFVWVGEEEAPAKFDSSDDNWMELCNDVFMEYNKTVENKFESLSQKNVDFGMGFERLFAYLSGKGDVFQTDVYRPIIKKIEEISNLEYGDKSDAEYIAEGKQCWVDVRRSFRIIADHLRAANEIILDGIIPDKNKEGSVLRTLLRVSFVELKRLSENKEKAPSFKDDWGMVEYQLSKMFYDYSEKLNVIISDFDKKSIRVINDEYSGYRKLRNLGIDYAKRHWNDLVITGETIFEGRGTFGLDPEGVYGLWSSFGKQIDPNWKEDYKRAEERHRELSRTASAGMFKGGLADAGEETKKLHTAAHLMLEALRRVLGDHVEQRGSNITAERLRFDFSHTDKMTDEQKAEVEKIVNEQIKKDLPIKFDEMSIEEADKLGATGAFKDRYGDKVKVYSVGDTSAGSDETFSREICGGPHVSRTGELGHFKIIKEESSSAGVRRIKAVLK